MGYRTLSLGWILVLTAFLFLATTRKAHAYIDPGTGSYLVQTALGIALAAAFAARMSWARVKERLVRALHKGHQGPRG